MGWGKINILLVLAGVGLDTMKFLMHVVDKPSCFP